MSPGDCQQWLSRRYEDEETPGQREQLCKKDIFPSGLSGQIEFLFEILKSCLFQRQFQHPSSREVGKKEAHFEHGAAGLRPLVAPELLGEVARRGGGDEVPDGLGDRVGSSLHHDLCPLRCLWLH